MVRTVELPATSGRLRLILADVGTDTILLVVGVIMTGVGIVLLVGASRLRTSTESRTRPPDVAHRASGPERMRNLIAAQQASRLRRETLGVRFRLVGACLAAAGAAAFIAGVALRAVPA